MKQSLPLSSSVHHPVDLLEYEETRSVSKRKRQPAIVIARISAKPLKVAPKPQRPLELLAVHLALTHRFIGEFGSSNIENFISLEASGAD